MDTTGKKHVFNFLIDVVFETTIWEMGNFKWKLSYRNTNLSWDSIDFFQNLSKTPNLETHVRIRYKESLDFFKICQHYGSELTFWKNKKNFKPTSAAKGKFSKLRLYPKRYITEYNKCWGPQISMHAKNVFNLRKFNTI